MDKKIIWQKLWGILVTTTPDSNPTIKQKGSLTFYKVSKIGSLAPLLRL